MFLFIQGLIRDAIEKIPDIWRGSPMEGIQKLTCDQSGKVGEKLVIRICEEAGISYEYRGDHRSSTVDSGKVYDLVIILNGRRINVEVKTARVSSTGIIFQHESLRNDRGSDFWIFVDIEPNRIHLFVVKDFDLSVPEKHPILGRKPHLRKDSTNTYKYDVGLTTLHRAEAAGIVKTFYNDDPETLKSVGEFVKSILTQ